MSNDSQLQFLLREPFDGYQSHCARHIEIQSYKGVTVGVSHWLMMQKYDILTRLVWSVLCFYNTPKFLFSAKLWLHEGRRHVYFSSLFFISLRSAKSIQCFINICWKNEFIIPFAIDSFPEIPKLDRHNQEV